MPTITIDGKQVKARAGMSVLNVCRDNDIWIPTLCHHDALSEYGACRLCLVQLIRKGRAKTTASCTLPIKDGMEIVTDSEHLQRQRQLVMELILASCPTSEAVQEMAVKLGARNDRLEQDPSNDCIRCGMCVRACAEISTAHAIDFAHRGVNRTIMTPFGAPNEECVLCGACTFVCPTGSRLLNLAEISGESPEALTSQFDANLAGRGAVHLPFPQASPNVPSIDRTACLRLNKDACGICEKVCEAGAIHFADQDVEEEIDIGAVVVTPGFEGYRPTLDMDTGYSHLPDVVTSVEFERILSASGPLGGHVKRPSNGQEPKHIAFLQCVGSRNVSCRNAYCSSVCCMHAIKEAVIAKEHMKGVEVTIFFMDLRAFGKDFDKYYERAKDDYGVTFVRARISDVLKRNGNEQLTVQYSPETGGVQLEDFDMVVLSVGIEPSAEAGELASTLGVRREPSGFFWTDPMAPLQTSRPGVFVGGAASGPKDIPETVTQASGAAGEVSRLLASARDTLTEEREYPPERDVSEAEPRIGVFVCHCGINIGSVVNVPTVANYAKTLPNVVYAEENIYTCAQDSQVHIRDIIRENELNRVVIASCSPRTHEPLFQQTLREAGLNPHLFEMANIRDQCSWIHQNEPQAATRKASDLIRMAVAKVRLAEPLESATLDVTPTALVIGGGLAGMSTALSIGDQGFRVTLVERDRTLGGNLKKLRHTSDIPDVRAYLKELEDKVRANKRITAMTGTRVEAMSGFVGNFESTLQTGRDTTLFKHGIVVLATGAEESVPQEYSYGKSDQIVTQLELEQRLFGRNPLDGIKTVVMVQCVGSREPGHMYCSRACCTTAVKNALHIKDVSPDTEVYILYRDMRTYGFAEAQFQAARDKGVLFVRFEPEAKPQVSGTKRLKVRLNDPLLDSELELNPDLLVLSSRMDVREGNEELGQLLKVPLNEDGFFLEAHVKLRPVEFATEGVFVAGLAHSPKTMPETIAQASAAASKACTILSSKTYEAEPTIAALNDDLCDGCGICVPVCEYNALEVVARPGGKEGEKIVRLNEAMCKGCGGCVAACPSGAMEQKGFKDNQMLAVIRAALAD